MFNKKTTILFTILLLVFLSFFVGTQEVRAKGTCECEDSGVTATWPLSESECTSKSDELLKQKTGQCNFTASTPTSPPTPAVGGPAAPAAPIVNKTKAMTESEANKAGKEAGKGVTKVNLDNPLGAGRVDIRTILGDIVNYGMGILGSVTLLVFVFGGFMWLTAAGSAEKVKKGSQTMLWAVVGLFLIFGSYAIIALVLEGIGAKEQESSTVPASTLNI